MEWIIVIICAATFLMVTSLILLGMNFLVRQEDEVDQRIAGLSSPSKTSKPNRPAKSARQSTPRVRLAMRLLPNDAEERHRLQARLMHAGVYSPAALPFFLGTKILLIGLPPVTAAVLGTAGYIDPHFGLLCGSIAGGIGLLLPELWLQACKRSWHTVIQRSLPDFLDLMVACLEAGLSAEAALQRVSEELRIAHPRLSAELGVVQAQIELGATSDAALKNFADRSDCDAIRQIATVVQQARRLGGGMAEAFRQQAETLRAKREHQAEEKAQQAAVKILVPTLLLIFPMVFVVLAGPAVIQLAEHFGKVPTESVATK